MGAGASSQTSSFEQMLACTMILGQAMVQGLDPCFVRFPGMYRLYDFHVGPKSTTSKATASKPFQDGNMVIFVHSPDDDGKFQQIELAGGCDTLGDPDTDDDDDNLPTESTDKWLVVFIGNDRVVLEKATLNQPNLDGWTPLHACAHTVNTQDASLVILHELIAQRADLNRKTMRGPGSFTCGLTPLHIACAYGLEVLALKLIRAGADVNTRNSVGWTPLYDACHRGYATIARELLKAGAKHDVVCPEFALCPFPGQHPLAEAARQGHVETVKLLLEWGVDKNATNRLGWTALHEAAYHSRLAIVQMLVVYGADVFVQTAKGSLAKDVTIHSDVRAMLDDLCQHGRPPSSSSSSSTTAPTAAAPAVLSSPTKDKSNSPTKARAAAPISRKEDYALLGDLPSLDASAVPAISIQDTSVSDNGGDEGGAKVHDQTQRSKSKHHAKKKHATKKSYSIDNAPDAFKCAVSRKVLQQPLRSPFGHVFERHVIEAWFRDFGNRCPLTGEPLTLSQLVRDDALKAQIRAWKHGGEDDEDDSRSASAVAKTTTAAAAVVKPTGLATEVAPGSGDVDPYDF